MKRFTDVQLFHHIKNDNRLAFCELVERYSPILFRFINKRIQCHEDSKDILQEVFSNFWLRRDKIEITDSLYPYLFASAKNEIIDRISKNKKHQTKLLIFSDFLTDIVSYSSEEVLMAKELDSLINKEVNKMPATMKAVFELSRNNKMPIKDIAKNLTISEQTVKNNISLALHRLRLKFK